jgi:hypothetical protein
MNWFMLFSTKSLEYVFANKYVRGFLGGSSYEAIPLEMNAYGLDSRFANNPAKTFSVAEVQSWIAASRF